MENAGHSSAAAADLNSPTIEYLNSETFEFDHITLNEMRKFNFYPNFREANYAF